MEIIRTIKSHSHNTRRSLADLIESIVASDLIATDDKVSEDESKRFTEGMYWLKNARFREERIMMDFDRFVRESYDHYKVRIKEPDLQTIEARFIYIGWTLCWLLALIEDAARYPIEKYKFKNVDVLNQDLTKESCAKIDVMMQAFLNIIEKLLP